MQRCTILRICFSTPVLQRSTHVRPGMLHTLRPHLADASTLSLWLKETRKLYVCYIMLSVTCAQLSSILLVLMFSGVLCFSTPW
jgi:hypothetical protein